MNQLTFKDGTFAGETIRTTAGGYASVYDIMRVAGVGRNSTLAWDELKHKLPAAHSSKYFKFAGRGQRDTPVINGQGLVRLLFPPERRLVYSWQSRPKRLSGSSAETKPWSNRSAIIGKSAKPIRRLFKRSWRIISKYRVVTVMRTYPRHMK